MAANMVNALVQSDAIRNEGKFKSAMAKINERRAELQAQDAIERGDKEASAFGGKVRQMVGTQRAGYASQGVVVDGGTAADVQAETRQMGAEDVQTIRNNAFREAMGFKSQAQDYAMQARMSKYSAMAQSGQTLLAGGMASAQAAGKMMAGGG